MVVGTMVQGHWNLGADGTPASDCYVQVRMSADGLFPAMNGGCSFLTPFFLLSF